jgi:protein-L-isoaspartate(D-aspartate) O-methyltransferase
MRLTPRHLFVPQTIRDMAYDDCALPIGHSATISQPYIVALMTELLFPGKRHRILEIGTGSGYQTALLAQLGRYVYTVEIVPELAESARATLADLKYSNVVVRQGDGYLGWPEEAPFDRIIITAAPRDLPQSLIDQLALGGRLVAPVGSTWGQQLILVEKDLDGATRRTPIAPVIFVPMRHAREWSP